MSRSLLNLLKTLPLLAVLGALLVPAGAQAAAPGVNIAGAPTPDRVGEAIATGAKTVRIFALWKDFEPDARGEFPSNDVNLANLSSVYDGAIRQLNAAGVQPLFVVTSAPSWANGSTDTNVPPANPADFGDFLRRWVEHNARVGPVAGYEVWNEPDADAFWHPGPDPVAYTALLKAAYAGIKAGDPHAIVATGPTTGNNYQWIENLYAAGAGGSFDAVSVHTDTSCLDRGPDAFYRENGGKLAQFTFLGYRSVHDTMVAHGDGNKPIWMSELGWSSTNGGPKSCSRGMWTGQKASGVTDADQATYLTKAYSCLANDPYVTLADWFTMRDTTAEIDELNHYGLVHPDGSGKPSLNAFKTVAKADGGAAGSCGDFDAPNVTIISPTPNEQFVDKLDISASATDGAGGVGAARVTFTFDKGQQIRNYTAGLDKAVGLSPWQGSGKLSYGPHTIEVTALDKNGNTTTKSVTVIKVRKLAATLTPSFKLKSKKVTCKKRACTFSGSLLRSPSPKTAKARPSIGGKVAVEWQFRNKKGKWRKLVGGLKPASKAFSFKAKVKYKGKWRVRVTYAGQSPYKKATSKYVTFTVK
ncbi:MAG TPA: Ig-like domain-containing protein [Baekduia sp.]